MPVQKASITTGVTKMESNKEPSTQSITINIPVAMISVRPNLNRGFLMRDCGHIFDT